MSMPTRSGSSGIPLPVPPPRNAQQQTGSSHPPDAAHLRGASTQARATGPFGTDQQREGKS